MGNLKSNYWEIIIPLEKFGIRLNIAIDTLARAFE
mgnify:CR=1 FL=1